MSQQHIMIYKYNVHDLLSQTLYGCILWYNLILSKGSIPFSITLSHIEIFVLVKYRTWWKWAKFYFPRLGEKIIIVCFFDFEEGEIIAG